MNKLSQNDDFEYGSLVYEIGNGQYSFTQGVALRPGVAPDGTVIDPHTMSDPDLAYKFVPKGARVVADAHSHKRYKVPEPGAIVINNDEYFSGVGGDRSYNAGETRVQNSQYRTGFLGTPSGYVKRMDYTVDSSWFDGYSTNVKTVYNPHDY
jgi:hypothetical protein